MNTSTLRFLEKGSAMTGAVSIGSGLATSDAEVLEMWRAEYLATLTEMISDLTVLCERELVDAKQGVLLDDRTLNILEALVRKGLPRDEVTKQGTDVVMLVRNELVTIIQEAVAARCFNVVVWVEYFEDKPNGGRKHTSPYVAFKRVTS